MADVSDDSTVVQERPDLEKLKKDLEGYRQLLLPLNRVLEWEQSYFPAVLVGLITFIFAIVWYLEPSVLTAFSMLGIVLCAVDFVVPMVTPYIFASAEWTVLQERQYENICIRILNCRIHFHNMLVFLSKLKEEKPKVYLLVMMGAFVLLAWIGSLIDNMLLTYLLVVFVVLVPGLRKHGILQKVTGTVSKRIKDFVNKKGLSKEKQK